jgi:deoxycytidylate deaminase
LGPNDFSLLFWLPIDPTMADVSIAKGWQANQSFSRDLNYLDLCLFTTRSSRLQQGGMACILVQNNINHNNNHNNDFNDRTHDEIDTTTTTSTSTTSSLSSFHQQLVQDIVSMATNQSFYVRNSSDIHAEIVALAQLAKYRRGFDVRPNRCRESCCCICYSENDSMINKTNSNINHDATAGADSILSSSSSSSPVTYTAYITMPPCMKCFAALVIANVTRIVSRYSSRCDKIRFASERYGITMISLNAEERHEQTRRVNDSFLLRLQKNDKNKNSDRGD